MHSGEAKIATLVGEHLKKKKKKRVRIGAGSRKGKGEEEGAAPSSQIYFLGVFFIIII
jgi:hypothetical protein